MSESGAREPLLNLDDVERALVLAREVAAATEHGGVANLRTSHLRELFAAGGSAPSPARMQLALTAAGLRVDPPLDTNPDSVSLKVLGDRAALAAQAPPRRRRPPPPEPDHDDGFEPDPEPPDLDFDEPAARWGADAYRRAAGLPDPEPPARGDFDLEADEDEFDEDDFDGDPVSPAEMAVEHQPALTDPHAPLTLGDMEKLLASQRSDDRTPALIAALLPALIVPVLVASFLGPIFGAIFAGLAALTAATLSRPGALAGGRIGPLRMPRTLPRSFLLITLAVAVLALAAAAALSLAGGTDTTKTSETQPLQTQPPTSTQKRTTPPAPPQNQTTTP